MQCGVGVTKMDVGSGEPKKRLSGIRVTESSKTIQPLSKRRVMPLSSTWRPWTSCQLKANIIGAVTYSTITIPMIEDRSLADVALRMGSCSLEREHTSEAEAGFVVVRNVRAEALTYLEAKAKTEADFSAALRNDKQKQGLWLFDDAGDYVVVVGLGDLGAVEGAGDEEFVGAEVVD